MRKWSPTHVSHTFIIHIDLLSDELSFLHLPFFACLYGMLANANVISGTTSIAQPRVNLASRAKSMAEADQARISVLRWI